MKWRGSMSRPHMGNAAMAILAICCHCVSTVDRPDLRSNPMRRRQENICKTQRVRFACCSSTSTRNLHCKSQGQSAKLGYKHETRSDGLREHERGARRQSNAFGDVLLRLGSSGCRGAQPHVMDIIVAEDHHFAFWDVISHRRILGDCPIWLSWWSIWHTRDRYAELDSSGSHDKLIRKFIDGIDHGRWWVLNERQFRPNVCKESVSLGPSPGKLSGKGLG